MEDIIFTNINNGDTGGVIRSSINDNFLKAKNAFTELEDRIDSSIKVITYTGNGSDSRAINVGFTPKFVLVMGKHLFAFKTESVSMVNCLDGGDGLLWESYGTTADGFMVSTHDSYAVNSSFYSTNHNGYTYTAICWQ